MKFIEHHIRLIVLTVFVAVIGTTAAVLWQGPQRSLSRNLKSPLEKYVCPMHPDITSDGRDNCPKCGMALVSANRTTPGHEQSGNNEEKHPGCCADKSGADSAIQSRLPPGHPPVPGWTTDAPPESEPVSTTTTTPSSH